MNYIAGIHGRFPELPAAHCELSAHGTASTKKSAIATAIRSLLNRPELKGKRFTEITNVTITVHPEATTTEFSSKES